MKIIKNGIIKSPENTEENYWWAGYDYNCKKCSCRFTLERADFPKLVTTMYEVTNYDHSKKDIGIYVNCPYCNCKLKVTKPVTKPLTVEEIDNSLFGEIFGDAGVFSKIFGEKPFKNK